MKKVFLYFFSILYFQYTSGQSSSIPIYYSPVSMPAFLKNNYYGLFDTKLIAVDLAGLLGKATGKSFIPTIYEPGAVTGIFLILDSNKRSMGNETGTIEADGKTFIRITSGYTTGISYAMYSWLEKLGFHFYLPGDEWTIIPSLNAVFDNKITKETYKPYFLMRMFNTSGGTPVVKGLDENKQNVKEWQQWYIRNRMGCDYIGIGGHIGEAFNISHRKEIENDTSIVAPIAGKRQYNAANKLDPTYKKGIDLFTDWIIDKFKQEQSTYPDFLPFKKYYTADAGDGFNYCHTPECEKQFKTVSDQAFSIVNEAAKKIRLSDQRAGVSTLAYTERADTPGIRIEPNIHVMVVPSAFQHVNTPAELIQSWAKKSDNISVYDYLNIGVKSYDEPFFNMYRYYNYLQFLKSLKIEGITFETSLSKFGSGILQYFSLKFLCDPYSSVDDVLNKFCNDNFGGAASPIKKLFKEWYFSDVHIQTNADYPSFSEDELGRFIKYIMDAESSPNLSPAIKKRIEELKAYTVYLCKFYELFGELKSIRDYKTNPSIRTGKTEEVLTYTWQLYFTKIFQNTQLNEMLKHFLTDQQKAKWDYYNSDHFKNITLNASSAITTEFEKLSRKYIPLAAINYPITDSLLAANIKYSADSICMSTMDEVSLGSFIYPIEFYCTSPGMLKISYQTDSSQAKNKAGKIAIVNVESSDYKFLKSDFVYKEKSAGTFIYQIPAKGHYRLYLSQYNATHVSYVIYPGNNLFYNNKKSILRNGLSMQYMKSKNFYPNQYVAFYAASQDSIYFSNFFFDAKNTSHFYSASGSPIVVHENNQLFYNSFATPKDLEYHFIFYENNQPRWPPVLKNAPPYYFFLKYPVK